MAVWYCGSTKWTAVTAWVLSTTKAAGVLCRQNAAPTVGNERVFVCTVAGTSSATEPTWVLTSGAKTTDNTVTWMEVTGKPGVNGDTVNCPARANSKAYVLGNIILDPVTSSLQICTTAATSTTSAPTFSATAGVVTSDGATLKWTSLGLASNFAAYAAPWACIQSPVGSGFMAAGDTLYVSNNHAETQAAAMTISPANGTLILPLNVVCVVDTVAPPTTTASTATVSTTGSNSLMVGNTACYYYGVNFSSGSAANTSSLNLNSAGAQTNGLSIFDTCNFTLGNTSTSSTFSITGSGTTFQPTIKLYNCNFVFGATGQSAAAENASEVFSMNGGGFALTGSVPTSLFKKGGFFQKAFNAVFDGVDFSAITGTIIDPSAGGAFLILEAMILNCKLGTGVTILGTGYEPQTKVWVHNSDSTNTNYRYALFEYDGSIVNENSIVFSGGASDGTTPISWNFTTNTNITFDNPLYSDWIAVNNSLVSGTHTVTVQLTSNAVLTNANMWLELECLQNASFPISTFVTTKVPLLATPTGLSAGSGSWGGTAQTFTYKIQATITPRMAGAIRARVVAAIPSATIYVNPTLNVS